MLHLAVVVILILNQLGPNGKLFVFDQDEDAWENTLADDRFTLIQENFRFIKDSCVFTELKK
jgi:16S rRNA (cytosine1402-N4)-methyltransferase